MLEETRMTNQDGRYRSSFGLVAISMMVLFLTFVAAPTEVLADPPGDLAIIYEGECEAGERGPFKGTLNFYIYNSSLYTKYYDLNVYPHGHSNLAVGGKQAVMFTLRGIPIGVRNAEVLAGSRTQKTRLASKYGVVFPCGKTETTRWIGPGPCDANKNRSMIAVITNPVPFNPTYMGISEDPDRSRQIHASHIVDSAGQPGLVIDLHGIPSGRTLYAYIHDDMYGPYNSSTGPIVFPPCE